MKMIVVTSGIPYELQISKILSGEGLVRSRRSGRSRFFWKILLIFSEFLTSRLSLFHSTIKEVRKEFLKYSRLI